MVIITAIILGFFSTAFAIIRAPVPVYVSACSIKFEKETTVEGLYAKTLSWSAGDDIETQISVIRSFSVLERVAEKLGLIPKRDEQDESLKLNVIGVVESLQSKVDVARESFTNIFSILVRDTDPAFAQKLANLTAVTYKELHSEQQSSRTTEAIKYIDKQLKDVRKKLRDAEDEFNRFTQENQLISIDLQSENLLSREQKVQGEVRKLQTARTELEGILERLKQFSKDPSIPGGNFSSAKANNQYQSNNDTLVGHLLKRETLLKDFTPQHPEVIAIGRKIVESSGKMVLLLELQIRVLKSGEGDLMQQLAGIKDKTGVLMDKKLEFNRLKRKVELHTNMTALLERKNQEALITKAEKPEEITIVKPALLPTMPINPPKTVTTGAMGVIIGLILGLVVAFVVETFDTSLGAIEDVEETLGSEVLGVIPDAEAKEIQELLEEAGPPGIEELPLLETVDLITHFIPKSIVSESFRALRANIQFKDAEKEIKTLAITSASPQEGKTFTSINLAITMAQAGMKILLIGADMRKPAMGRALGLEIAPGLTDILMGNHEWRDVVKTITDLIMGKMTMDVVMMTPGLDNLNIITSGPIPPNPSVLIESKRMKEFIVEAGHDYDLLIFDAPPILSAADVAILGSKMDGVLLVYRVGSISRGLLKRSATQLEQAKCNLLGVILNGMKPEFSPDFQDFKYYKYYYSSEEEEGEVEEPGGFLKGLSFRKPERKRQHMEEVEGTSGETAEVSAEGRSRSSGILRWVFLVIALALLATGVLWQNGLIDPMKMVERREPVEEDEERTVINKTLQRGEVKEDIYKKPMPIKENGPAAIKKTTPNAPAPSPQKIETRQVLGSEKEGLSRSYSVYLGSFRTLKRAEDAISQYRQRGLYPYWVKLQLKDKGEWFRVFEGAFKNHGQAEQFIQDQGLEGAVVKKTGYANLIGTYPSGAGLQDQIVKLKDIGYFPYVVKQDDGDSTLFIGAFSTETAARQQHLALNADGIENQVVKR